MGRRLKWILGLAILAAGCWYFFLKDHHYQVSFRSEHPPSLVYQHILDWDDYDRDSLELEIQSENEPSEIIQEVRVADSSFTYRWELENLGPGITKVTAYITDNNNNFIQKVQVPFGKNDFISRSLRNTETVAKALKLTSETYKVHSITDSIIEPMFCIYMPLSSKVEEKARTMLSGINTLMNYIQTNGISIEGDPFVEVTRWDEDSNTIDFNFGFPVEEPDSIMDHPDLKFKTMERMHALKAEFNGNYRISHKAWYYLLDHAEWNGYKVKKLPFEVYLNDPHTGGDPLLWKALIFLPLDE